MTDRIFAATKAVHSYRILEAQDADLATQGESSLGGMVVVGWWTAVTESKTPPLIEAPFSDFEGGIRALFARLTKCALMP